MSDSPVPGWYDDPQDSSQLRWWDGSDWTDKTRAKDEPAAGDAAAQSGAMPDVEPAAASPALPETPAEAAAPAATPPVATPPVATPGTPAMPGMPGGFVPPQQTGTPGLATASLITGIASIIMCCCFLPIPLGIAAIVTGVMARKQIEESGGALSGKGMATAGMICGIVGIALNIILNILGAAIDIAEMS